MWFAIIDDAAPLLLLIRSALSLLMAAKAFIGLFSSMRALTGHVFAQRPQSMHFSWSICGYMCPSAPCSVILMAFFEQVFIHAPQPVHKLISHMCSISAFNSVFEVGS